MTKSAAQFTSPNPMLMPIPVGERSKARACGCSFAPIAESNPAEGGVNDVCCD